MPDRIEAGTFLCAVAAAGGDVVLRRARADHLEAVIDKLREAGATIDAGDGWIRVRADARPRAVSFRTSEYPAFPTDMQAQFMALDCIAEGAASDHRDDLREPLHARAGADPARRDIEVDGRIARGPGRRAAVGRDGDGDRPARLRRAW